MSEATPADVVRAYHQRTKHRLDAYAAGPGSLDWDAQPDPFRRWLGAETLALPRDAGRRDVDWHALGQPRPAVEPDADALGDLLQLCAGITAWKAYAGSRWALRAHPSSGNLHPTETWVIARGVAGLADGLYHYQSRDHGLERRADGLIEPGPAGLWLGFSSIAWREAWKYGERAFRYCQLDMGHVLAAVASAAALLGWRPRVLALDCATLTAALGLDRTADFAGVETEDAEVILALSPADAGPPPTRWATWHGLPSLLDPRPMYRWPVIDEVTVASRGMAPATPMPAPMPAPVTTVAGIGAVEVILKRRSAQSFDGRSILPASLFPRLLSALTPGGAPVWALWPWPPRVHVVMMAHRVEELAAGVYLLPRSEAGADALRQAMRDDLAWENVEPAVTPPGTPTLRRLVRARCANAARTVSCHQDIAADCAVAFMLVAEFDAPIAENPAAYRHLHWEAGMIGHQLYLEAEAAGWRGTGIGCFFDDAIHDILGLADTRFQVLYHFSVGVPVDDPRLLTLPAYD